MEYFVRINVWCFRNGVGVLHQESRNRFNIEAINLIHPEFPMVYLQLCNVLFKYYK